MKSLQFGDTKGLNDLFTTKNIHILFKMLFQILGVYPNKSSIKVS